MAKAKKNVNFEIEIRSLNDVVSLSKEFNCRQRVKFTCEDCRKTVSLSLRQAQKRLETGNLLCGNCSANISKLKKYGVNFKKVLGEKCSQSLRNRTKEQIDEATKKYRLSCLEKYGVDNPNKNADIIAKTQKTNLERYGVKSTLNIEISKKRAQASRKTEESLKKKSETWKNRTLKQKEASRKKTKQTCLERYGVEWVSQSATVKNKIAKARDGFSNEKLKSIQRKRQDTCIKKYGFGSACQNPLIKKKIILKMKQTCLERYGVENVQQTIDIHYKRKSHYEYDGFSFDSLPELAFYIYHSDLGKTIIPHKKSFSYIVDNKEHKYFPDFEVDNKLFEIKGDQFLKNDGTWCCPFDHSKDYVFEAKRQCALENNVQIIYADRYQAYLDYVKQKYSKDFMPLFKTNIKFPFLNEDLKEKTDFAIIQHFHKSIYEASKKGKLSPLQAWNDKRIVKNVALNRLKYVGHCKPSDILQGFSVTRIAPKVSVFKPKLAENLIKKYLNEFSEIVDPFSGFSGRMIGSANCGKKYIGKDINKKHVAESNEIIKYKDYQNCSVYVEDILKKEDVETHECLFTCPPYGSKEHWSKSCDEIELSCDEWIDVCLEKYKCKKYLFVVDETEKYKDCIVENLQNKDGLFCNKQEYVLIF